MVPSVNQCICEPNCTCGEDDVCHYVPITNELQCDELDREYGVTGIYDNDCSACNACECLLIEEYLQPTIFSIAQRVN